MMKMCCGELESAMRNWSRWAVGHAGGPMNRLSSLEGRYTPPPDEDAIIRKSYEPIDEADAVRVENIVRTLEHRQKKILKHFYIYRSDPRHVCRRMRISSKAYELELLSAHSRISLYYFM